MKIKVIFIGKSNDPSIENWIAEYKKRLSVFVRLEIEVIPDIKEKKLSIDQQKTKEGQALLARLQTRDFLILLDERGKMLTSPGFADFFHAKTQANIHELVFVIGGAYGFSAPVYARANDLLSLSSMTFSHQMIRIFLVEQIYRAFAILNNLPYHHA